MLSYRTKVTITLKIDFKFSYYVLFLFLLHHVFFMSTSNINYTVLARTLYMPFF